MIYQESPPSDRLEQGDVLDKTAALSDLLATYHPYYAQHQENKFFVVLTQSCDLVRREGRCKARYISIAPVRPLRSVLKREFEGKLDNVGLGQQPFASVRVRNTLEQFLQRLFNNNEPAFFYFESANTSGIYEEMCAMLALPISLKPEHYESLLRAKLAGISDVFQAKLGWLLGQMYSRVGTPDLEPSKLTAKVSEYTDGIAVWLEDSKAKSLKKMVKGHKQSNTNAVIGREEIMQMVDKLPKRKAAAIEAIVDIAVAQGLAGRDSNEHQAFRRALENSPVLAGLLGGA